MNKIYWFYCRLKAMSLLEILYRIKEKIKKEKYKKIYSYKKNIIQIKSINISKYKLKDIDNRLNIILKKIDINKLDINSNINIYGELINLNNKISWHKTYKGKEWNKNISCFDIKFKNKDDFGELRYTWEFNRHLFFPNLALRYVNNSDEKSYETLKEYFYDWINENPFLYGVNWMSPMEISIRAYQWLITYSLIKNKADEEFKKDILKAIINSMEYVYNNFSKYSSANNHLIVEAAITSIIGYCIEPIYSQKWFKCGYDILNKEILLQVHNDGINKEQATHYHAFVLDMMLQYNIFLKSIKHITLHEDIIFKMAEFIGYIYNEGNVVEFGDSDDAKLLDLDGHEKNYYTFVLQLASIYYKKKFIDIRNLYLEARFLTGKSLLQVKDSIKKHNYDKIKIYSKGGYCIINENKDFLLFDIGELGLGSIAAHGHADALSIVYYNNNKPIFIDSGTYIYNVENKWRNYFRETENHNTLSIENKSQSRIEGPFLWSKKAKVSLIDSGENKEIVYFSAEQDGYFPHIHQRNISYLKNENIMVLEDSFSGKGTLNYIIDENVEVNKLNNNLIKLNEIYFYCSNEIEIVKRYVSKSFLSKEETIGLKIVNDFTKNKKIYSLISREPVKFKDNKIILNEGVYEYINYNNIRSEMSGNG